MVVVFAQAMISTSVLVNEIGIANCGNSATDAKFSPRLHCTSNVFSLENDTKRSKNQDFHDSKALACQMLIITYREGFSSSPERIVPFLSLENSTMFNKFFLAPTILSIAGLLMGPNSVSAQHHGHSSSGHSSNGHSHSGHSHSGHNYSGHGYGGHGYGGFGYSGFGFGGYGNGWYGGGYYPGIFGGSYPWYDTYSSPRYSYYDAPAIQYYPPAMDAYVQPAPFVSDFANVRVILPDPQARVWFDGNSTSQTGPDRLYHTPTLTMGSAYRYQIRTSWMENGREVSQERTVSVTPGQTTVADFTR